MRYGIFNIFIEDKGFSEDGLCGSFCGIIRDPSRFPFGRMEDTMVKNATSLQEETC